MSSGTYAVNVSNISATTSVSQLHDFFTFCGKIEKIDHDEKWEGPNKKATVHFEKPSAAKTALMLNGGTLDGSQLQVTSEVEHPEEDQSTPHADGAPYHQSDKPRAGIAAEYLAKGYSLSDNILARAIDIDQKKGISSRFLNYFNSFDKTVGEKALGPEKTVSGSVQTGLSSGMESARAFDQQKGISKTATDKPAQYYSKAMSSSWGQKVYQFYTQSTKQIQDIHEEARRIADQHKQHGTAPSPGGSAAPSHPAPPAYPTDEKSGYTVDEKPKVQ